MKTSTEITKLAVSLLKAQKAMGAAKKEANNPFFHSTYADLGSIMEVCKGPLNDNDIIVLQPVVGTMVETTLIHSSGEWMSSETPIVSKETNNPQSLGSAISYARRYGLQSMLFIPAEDDDANSATVHEEVKREPSQTVRLASEKQIQLISILLGKKGYSDEQLKTKYHVTSKKELSSVQASEIIDNLNKLPDSEVVDPSEVKI